MTTAYADRIKELRVRRAWSQDVLAAISGISVRTVQRIEAGQAVAFDTLKALANALDINVTDLGLAKGTPPPTDPDGILLLPIQTGRDLFTLVHDAKLYGLDHGEIDAEMVELVASFLQDVKDQADIGRYMGPGDWIRTYSRFTSRIHELEDAGLCVFAMRRAGVATVYVVKSTDPAIVRLDGEVADRSRGRSGA